MGSDLGKITEGLSTSGMVKDLSIQLSVLGSLDDPKRTLNCCNSRSTTDKSPWNKKKRVERSSLSKIGSMVVYIGIPPYP
jgi:hypothetical protein